MAQINQDLLTLDLSTRLQTEALARVIELHEELPSTNDRAIALAKSGAAHGVTVLALSQSKGRGQRAHSWHSPAGAGLYVSFIVRPNLLAKRSTVLPIITGLALAEAAQTYVTTRLAIKWPNDLLVAQGPLEGRKLAGVLVEATIKRDKIEHAVIGIGINLHEVDRPKELAGVATSMEALGVGANPDMGTVLCAIAQRLEQRLKEAELGLGDIRKAWRTRAFLRGCRVQVEGAGETVFGLLDGVEEDGGLVLETDTGRRVLRSGTLKLR